MEWGFAVEGKRVVKLGGRDFGVGGTDRFPLNFVFPGTFPVVPCPDDENSVNRKEVGSPATNGPVIGIE